MYFSKFGIFESCLNEYDYHCFVCLFGLFDFLRPSQHFFPSYVGMGLPVTDFL